MCFFHVEDDFTLDYIVSGNVILTLVSNITGFLESYFELPGVNHFLYFVQVFLKTSRYSLMQIY